MLSKMNSLQVVSYNILSKPLCRPDVFTPEHYNPGVLQFDMRYTLLINKLEKHIANKAVICLQEVDVESAGRLQLDFKCRGYDWVYHPYGTSFNGYMGVAIAYPNNLQIKSIDRFRLMDGKQWPDVNNRSWVNRFIKFMTFGYLDFTKDYLTWYKMKAKYNFMITLEIMTGQDDSIFVGTVHMPCEFMAESIMITSAGLAMEHIQKLANGRPYVLAGDFNVTPGSNVYRLLTTGECDEMAIERDFPIDDLWRTSKLCLSAMSSASWVWFDNEPAWTTNSICTFGGRTNAFRNTLDYIFISEPLRVSNAFVYAENNELCPNNTQPSDHLLIWADLMWNRGYDSKI
jgi:mRNA deadenylase 3'-5' endonuclease subunit Ccr4